MTSSQTPLAIEHAIDVGGSKDPPLDFTFMCLTTALDCLDEEPRERNCEGVTKKQSPLKLNEKGKEVKKRKTNAIRLSNNVIADWTNFSTTIEKLVENPQELEWIDLSFNDLTTIDKCLLDYPNLKVLYLHGNGIEKIGEVDKLCSLQNLKTFTLHGNPVEESEPGYRQYVLSKLSQLRNFDFSGVTKSDRACAQTWNGMSKGKRKQKR